MKFTAIFAIGIALFSISSLVRAAGTTTANFPLTVIVLSGTINIAAGNTDTAQVQSRSFGVVNLQGHQISNLLYGTSNNAPYAQVFNIGGAYVDYSVSLSAPNWTADTASSPGNTISSSNLFRLAGVFTGYNAVLNWNSFDRNTTRNVIGTTAKTADSTHQTYFLSITDALDGFNGGYNVQPDFGDFKNQRTLRFLFDAPGATTFFSTQTISLVITANTVQ